MFLGRSAAREYRDGSEDIRRFTPGITKQIRPGLSRPVGRRSRGRAGRDGLCWQLGSGDALHEVPHDLADDVCRVPTLLFAESNSRFVCEVLPEQAGPFQDLLAASGVPCAAIGRVTAEPRLQIRDEPSRMSMMDATCEELKMVWQDNSIARG